MRDKYGVEQDVYCYTNSTVLINLLDIQDPKDLEEAEAEFTLARAQTYEPTFSSFDLNHLKNIHHYLFQDIYSWAGQIRTVDVSKGDTRFCTWLRIVPEAEKILQNLEKLPLSTMSIDHIAPALAEHYCDLNVAHPFRDGNGRAQRLFFDEFVGNHFFKIDWEVVGREEWIQANIAGFHCDYRAMAEIFIKAIYSH